MILGLWVQINGEIRQDKTKDTKIKSGLYNRIIEQIKIFIFLKAFLGRSVCSNKLNWLAAKLACRQICPAKLVPPNCCVPQIIISTIT